MNYLWETFKITFYLVLIIGFILAIYYLLKNRFNLTNSRQMQIIDTMRLANGETIYLVKVFDEIVMLGGSKEELNYLKSWPIDQLDVDFKDLKKAKSKNGNFKSKFKNILTRNQKSYSSDQDD
ncbi:flagellar protein FliO/FliZ [Halanaerobium saccharolyticum]|uniref:Flagellar protein FliO/FliZ n=1 Tax=Halanaerobium saccharolyticum TaxID=43595 RepID=A0A4R6RR07_9FIRM|nr:flagellar biosynthetic protein FliO [Halanaerobium saccharolyticum]TDP89243.1 flagellar protein FliO/FliZ [Halanaerobium saccharolyticum]